MARSQDALEDQAAVPLSALTTQTRPPRLGASSSLSSTNCLSRLRRAQERRAHTRGAAVAARECPQLRERASSFLRLAAGQVWMIEDK
jgi:hypothetical protein